MKKTGLKSRNSIFSHGRHTVTFALALVAIFTALSQAVPVTLDNGGFEDGNLTGWDNLTQGVASIDVVSSHTDTNPLAQGITSWTPTEGSRFALLSAGGMGEPAVLSRTFTVAQGDVLTFDYFWDSQDEGVMNDIATGYIRTEDFLFMESVLTDPMDLWGTPWTSISYTFTQSGTYILDFNINNVNSTLGSSYLGIDNVQIPEPTTVALLGLGVLILGRKRRA